MRAVVLASMLTLSLPAGAHADVAPPFGWRPSPAPEHSHVVVLRRSLAEWMTPDERAQLDAIHVPRCGSRSGRTLGAGYGRPCADLDRVRAVAVDRAVRFFAAELREARGDQAAARALRDLPPIRDRRAQRAALDLLGPDPELQSARALAIAGTDWSLERLATELGRLVRGVVDAGAPRDRVVAAALAMLPELVRPLAAVTVRVEASGEARRFGYVAAPRARTCLESLVEARWRPVAARVVLARGAGRLHVAVSAPAPTAACVTAAMRDAERRSPSPPPAGVMVVRFIVGPDPTLWGLPVDLAAED